ncbi:MAG: DUF3540 domain-containing protein [Pseudomonadales bacterium]|nr:DUF3540 domain-containing protein [Pseudomonadales bacterium]
MINVAKIPQKESSEHYLGAANVIGLVNSEGLLRLRLSAPQAGYEVVARNTVPLNNALEIGDEVLVNGDIFNDMYVIGLLAAIDGQQKKTALNKLEMGDGSYALLDDTSVSPALKIFSKRNELLIEYDPDAGKTRINIDTGNLEFIARNGNIVLDSANSIQLKGQNIEILGQAGVQLGVLDTFGRLSSSFSLSSCATSLSAARLNVTAHLTELQLKETRFFGSKFRGKIEDSQLLVDKLSTVANTISEKAKNVYRSAEELTQLKTGRMRTLVASTFHLKAKNSYIKSQEDFKVNADKIHLG